MKKCNNLSILLKGILLENPVFVLVLGTCPTLAITKSVTSAIGMGLAATAVLICSNMVISLLRKVIPDSVRIPSYIVVIASFVTLVQMLIHAFVPTLYEMLGVFLPLITVNCIILGRAEMFANKTRLANPLLTAWVWVLALPWHFFQSPLFARFWVPAHSQVLKYPLWPTTRLTSWLKPPAVSWFMV